jgi:hypothetical protein
MENTSNRSLRIRADSRIDSTGLLEDDLRQEIRDISAAFREKWKKN